MLRSPVSSSLGHGVAPTQHHNESSPSPEPVVLAGKHHTATFLTQSRV